MESRSHRRCSTLRYSTRTPETQRHCTHRQPQQPSGKTRPTRHSNRHTLSRTLSPATRLPKLRQSRRLPPRRNPVPTNFIIANVSRIEQYSDRASCSGDRTIIELLIVHKTYAAGGSSSRVRFSKHFCEELTNL